MTALVVKEAVYNGATQMGQLAYESLKYAMKHSENIRQSMEVLMRQLRGDDLSLSENKTPKIRL